MKKKILHLIIYWIQYKWFFFDFYSIEKYSKFLPNPTFVWDYIPHTLEPNCTFLRLRRWRWQHASPNNRRCDRRCGRSSRHNNYNDRTFPEKVIKQINVNYLLLINHKKNYQCFFLFFRCSRASDECNKKQPSDCDTLEYRNGEGTSIDRIISNKNTYKYYYYYCYYRYI